MKPEFKIGERVVGPGHPVYIIAEAGSNHDQKMDQAKRLVDIAVDAGADAVKFQTFQAEKIATRAHVKIQYLEDLGFDIKEMQDLYRPLELPREWHAELAEYTTRQGIDFLSTPFDEDAVDLLDGIGVKAFKIASFELWHLPLIRHAARKGKPILLSTGMANLGDIEDALDAVRAEGNDEAALFHCAISYPVPFPDVNLRAMQTMQQAFGIPVGLSDHSAGITAPIAATALGACMVEKHFTLDRTLPGPDHRFAIDPHELKAMVRAIRDTELAMGSPVKHHTAAEEEYISQARRSIHAVRDIPQGTIITRDMVAILRPGTGLLPKFLDIVIGRRAAGDIAAHEPITWEVLG
jgi:pseudaminic acid synthase